MKQVIFLHLHNRGITSWLLYFGCCFFISWIPALYSCNLPELFNKLYSQTILPYLWMFIFAMFIAEYFTKFQIYIKKYWFIPIVINVILNYLNLDVMAGYGLLKTITLFTGLLGFSYALPGLNLKTDISYGIYIYHMTIINAIIELGYLGLIPKHWLLLIALTFTCVLAWISNRTIGEWGLSKKKSLMKQKTHINSKA